VDGEERTWITVLGSCNNGALWLYPKEQLDNFNFFGLAFVQHCRGAGAALQKKVRTSQL
jgi:hypothetical protein